MIFVRIFPATHGKRDASVVATLCLTTFHFVYCNDSSILEILRNVTILPYFQEQIMKTLHEGGSTILVDFGRNGILTRSLTIFHRFDSSMTLFYCARSV